MHVVFSYNMCLHRLQCNACCVFLHYVFTQAAMHGVRLHGLCMVYTFVQCSDIITNLQNLCNMYNVVYQLKITLLKETIMLRLIFTIVIVFLRCVLVCHKNTASTIATLHKE